MQIVHEVTPWVVLVLKRLESGAHGQKKAKEPFKDNQADCLSPPQINYCYGVNVALSETL